LEAAGVVPGTRLKSLPEEVNVFKQIAIAVALASTAATSLAADRIKVGFLSTMSGPGGYFGSEARDGFNLLLKQRGGRLGNLPAEVQVADDQFNPDAAKQAIERLVRRERVDIIAGTINANIVLAVHPFAASSETFMVSTIAGPSELAGEKCSPWFFTVGYQNDNPHEAMGKHLQDKGLKSVLTLVPNFPSGRDAVAGLKRYYKGNVASEIYIKINQLDYAAEIGQIRAAKPEAVFIFLPGAMGINFIKQYQQAGLLSEIPLYGFGFNFEEDIIKAVGDSVVGAYNSLQWGRDLDNAANKQFVQAFEKEYGRPASAYAALGYDTAALIDAAVRDVNGKIEDKAALRQAMRAAKFESVRGDFKFNTNHMPIQTFYLRQVVKDGGQIRNKVIGTIFKDHRDSFASACQMK
jgi:branched-chain amino acid transport system substrate-binding protein